MKNKVLATLLAVCLFAGLAVPAFAASSQSGSNEDITTLAFPEASYTIKNGDTKDLAKEVQAYAGAKQLVQEPSLVWSVENDTKFAFGVDDNGKVTANEDAGAATIKVTAKDGKVVGTVKVNAAKKTTIYATGYQFKTTTAKLLTGGSAVKGEGNTIEIIPTPKDSIFTVAQQQAIATAVEDGSLDYVAKTINGADITVAAGASVAEDKITVTYPNGAEDATVADITPATFVVTISTASTLAITTKPTMVIKGANSSKSTVTAKSVPGGSGKTADEIAAAFVGSTVKLNGVEYTAKAASTADETIIFTANKKGEILTANLIAVDATPAALGGSATAQFTVGAGVNGAGATNSLSTISVAKVDSKSYELGVAFPRATDGTVPSTITKRTIKISGEAAAPATKIYAAGNITIEVGEKASMKKQFKQGPSSSNINGTVEYGLDAADVSSAAVDYADFTNSNDDDKSEIIGVAVGTNRVTATANGETVSVLVTVVAKGTKPAEGGKTAVLSPVQLNLGVGGTSNIVVKDATADIKYSSYFPEIATVDAAGKITAVKEGTVKIKITEEGKEPAYVTVTIGAATTKPADKPTDVPQTAVAALVALF